METKYQRRLKLSKKLEQRGLEFRLDSALCSNYINGKTELDVDLIVERLCQMKYLYEYCNMKEIKTQVYNKFIEEKIKEIGSKETVSMCAERLALEKYSGGKYPPLYPWEQSMTMSNIYLNKFLLIIGSYFLILSVGIYFISR